MDTSGESDSGWPEGIRVIRQTLSGLYVADLALGDELVALSVINQASELLALGDFSFRQAKKPQAKLRWTCWRMMQKRVV